LNKVLDNPDISVAVELVGGLEPARSIVLKLLESGKDVVTANKPCLPNTARNCSTVPENLAGR